MVDLDQTGSQLDVIARESCCKGIGPSGKGPTTQKSVCTRVRVANITVIPVVDDTGFVFGSAVVIPCSNPHYCPVNVKIQTLNDFLPPFYYREEAEGYKDICFDWFIRFLVEIVA